MGFRDEHEATRRRLGVVEDERREARAEAERGRAAKQRAAELAAEVVALRAAAANAAESDAAAEPTVPAAELASLPDPTPAKAPAQPEKPDPAEVAVRLRTIDDGPGPWGYISAMVVAGIAYAIAMPHRTDFWPYIPGTLVVGALLGYGLEYAWREWGWEFAMPFLPIVLVVACGALAGMRRAGDSRLECLERNRQRCGWTRPNPGKVAAHERRDDVAGQTCTLDYTLLDEEGACVDRCDVVIRCGESVLVDERDVEGCTHHVDSDIVTIERAVSPGSDDERPGIELRIDRAGRGRAVIYREPGKGRLPWRVEIAFATN